MQNRKLMISLLLILFVSISGCDNSADSDTDEGVSLVKPKMLDDETATQVLKIDIKNPSLNWLEMQPRYQLADGSGIAAFREGATSKGNICRLDRSYLDFTAMGGAKVYGIDPAHGINEYTAQNDKPRSMHINLVSLMPDPVYFSSRNFLNMLYPRQEAYPSTNSILMEQTIVYPFTLRNDAGDTASTFKFDTAHSFDLLIYQLTNVDGNKYTIGVIPLRISISMTELPLSKTEINHNAGYLATINQTEGFTNDNLYSSLCYGGSASQYMKLFRPKIYYPSISVSALNKVPDYMGRDYQSPIVNSNDGILTNLVRLDNSANNTNTTPEFLWTVITPENLKIDFAEGNAAQASFRLGSLKRDFFIRFVPNMSATSDLIEPNQYNKYSTLNVILSRFEDSNNE